MIYMSNFGLEKTHNVRFHWIYVDFSAWIEPSRKEAEHRLRFCGRRIWFSFRMESSNVWWLCCVRGIQRHFNSSLDTGTASRPKKRFSCTKLCCEQEQEEAEKRAQEKIEKRVYDNWKRLIKGLLIRERLKAKYDFGAASTSGESKQKRKAKPVTLVVKKRR